MKIPMSEPDQRDALRFIGWMQDKIVGVTPTALQLIDRLMTTYGTDGITLESGEYLDE